jgi:hypothetical protein
VTGFPPATRLTGDAGYVRTQIALPGMLIAGGTVEYLHFGIAIKTAIECASTTQAEKEAALDTYIQLVADHVQTLRAVFSVDVLRIGNLHHFSPGRFFHAWKISREAGVTT